MHLVSIASPNDCTNRYHIRKNKQTLNANTATEVTTFLKRKVATYICTALREESACTCMEMDSIRHMR